MKNKVSFVKLNHSGCKQQTKQQQKKTYKSYSFHCKSKSGWLTEIHLELELPAKSNLSLCNIRKCVLCVRTTYYRAGGAIHLFFSILTKKQTLTPHLCGPSELVNINMLFYTISPTPNTNQHCQQKSTTKLKSSRKLLLGRKKSNL